MCLIAFARFCVPLSLYLVLSPNTHTLCIRFDMYQFRFDYPPRNRIRLSDFIRFVIFSSSCIIGVAVCPNWNKFMAYVRVVFWIGIAYSSNYHSIHLNFPSMNWNRNDCETNPIKLTYFRHFCLFQFLRFWKICEMRIFIRVFLETLFWINELYWRIAYFMSC